MELPSTPTLYSTFFVPFQTWEERSPSTIYEELCVYRKEKAAGGDNTGTGWNKKGRANGSTATKNVITRLVLILSNWSFVRDHKENPQKVKCSLHNVTVGLKLSSTEFRSGAKRDPNQQYDFDKNGLILPYPAFLSLLKDSAFVDDFMTKVEKRYIADTGDILGKKNPPATSAAATSGSRKKPPTTASLRRQYDEAFPELLDSEENDLDEGGKKKRSSKSRANRITSDDEDNDDDDDEEAGDFQEEARDNDDLAGGEEEDENETEDDRLSLARSYNEAEEVEAIPSTQADFKKPVGRPRGKVSGSGKK